jgi:hypothetical protein
MGYIVAYLALIVTALYGWVMNMVVIAGSDFSMITGLLILRLVGIFLFPIGAVLGFV